MTAQTSSENNKRIAKNTLLLYFRMIFMMAVSLYTSRVVLNTLGVEDFGIYNVIGGVVAMFSIISGGLSAAISRYITFELGQDNIERLKSVFSSSVTIQIGLAVLIFLLAEVGGIWFLNEKMNLPESRIGAGNWVLQCSILTFMVNLISVPYNAAIIAHERMQAFAYISILEAILKLSIVYILVISTFDKLKLYGILLLAVACIIRIAYGFYCKRNFKECTYHFAFNKVLLKEMMGFAGWNFIGSFSGVLRDQGVNIVINLFCGPVINAARAIAFQVNIAVNGFATNFMTAINPQITKSYASGDYPYMLTLVKNGARYSFYLLLLLSLPILIETNTILTLWLKNVPEHTTIFVRLVLIFAMCEALSSTQITALQATGKIRNYQIVVGGIQLLNFPISYLLLEKGYAPETTMYIAICLSLVCLYARLWFLKQQVDISMKSFFSQVLFNVCIVAVLAAICPIIVNYLMVTGFLRLFVVSSVCAVTTSVVIYYVGLSTQERIFVQKKIVVKIKQKLSV